MPPEICPVPPTPVDACVPAPPFREAAPAVPEAADVGPAIKSLAPPPVVEDDPPTIWMYPEESPNPLPVVISILPDEPLVEDPVLNSSAPETPFVPAPDVFITTAPLDLVVP